MHKPCYTARHVREESSLSGRWLQLHLPRLSPPAAADEPEGRARGRGLWLYDDALEARQGFARRRRADRSEEHTSELQSLMRISYAVFCLKKKNRKRKNDATNKMHTDKYYMLCACLI